VTNELTSSDVSSPHPDSFDKLRTGSLPEGEGTFWIRHRNYEQEPIDHAAAGQRGPIVTIGIPLEARSVAFSARPEPREPCVVRGVPAASGDVACAAGRGSANGMTALTTTKKRPGGTVAGDG